MARATQPFTQKSTAQTIAQTTNSKKYLYVIDLSSNLKVTHKERRQMPVFAHVFPDTRRTVSLARSALRAEVERWFNATSGAHVSQFGRIYPGGSRFVCLNARNESGAFALYFFHHGMNDWRIYPPRGIGPSIVYWSAGMNIPQAIAEPA
jgi:hypothetical protein